MFIAGAYRVSGSYVLTMLTPMLILLAVSRTRMHFHICSVREIERRK